MTCTFAAGLNTMNIAPEFGQIESMTYLEAMDGRPELVESFYPDLFGLSQVGQVVLGWTSRGQGGPHQGVWTLRSVVITIHQ